VQSEDELKAMEDAARKSNSESQLAAERLVARLHNTLPKNHALYSWELAAQQSV
jgi:hypothetical protein